MNVRGASDNRSRGCERRPARRCVSRLKSQGPALSVPPTRGERAIGHAAKGGERERGVENSRYIDVITESAPSAQQTKAADYDGHRVAQLD